MTYKSLCAAGIALGLLSFSHARGAMEISSPDFASGQPMPAKYSKDHGNISPALRLKGVPEGTKTLVLIVDDPDAPKDGIFAYTHWIVFQIDPHHALFMEGRPPHGAIQGKNSFGDNHYDGPKPPSGTHRYVFHLYALNVQPAYSPTATRADVEKALAPGRVLAKAEMFGTYQDGR